MSSLLPQSPRVLVVGATGAVGRELCAVLAERDFGLAALVLLASERSAGTRVAFRETELEVGRLDSSTLASCGVDLAFFATSAELAARYVPDALAAGMLVVDLSSAHRLEPDVPLVVPEVNGRVLAESLTSGSRRLVANPNCSIALLAPVLAPIASRAGLRRVVVSTYQAASGAGEAGMQALVADTRRASVGELGGRESCPEVFGHALAFNLVPQIDSFGEDGRTGEERKMVEEGRKILGLPELRMDATCVRVPVLRSHSESVTVETKTPLAPEAARATLEQAPGIRVVDDPASQSYPTPLASSGTDEVLVGRLRASSVFDGGLSFWICGDQLRKGAALNAVQIIEALTATERNAAGSPKES